MSNLNLNKVVLCGRLTADPELKQTQNGIAVVSFTLAVNRRFQRGADGQNNSQADFINCVAWRQTAEFISKYFRKGSSLCITGSIQTRSWADNAGAKRYATEVVVDEAMFVDSRAEAAGSGSYIPDAYGSPSFSSGADAPNFEEIKTDDDLPF
ncbi:MAG: single-stranded DNA-binding protein [Eubacteriales bacterium]